VFCVSTYLSVAAGSLLQPMPVPFAVSHLRWVSDLSRGFSTLRAIVNWWIVGYESAAARIRQKIGVRQLGGPSRESQ